MCSCIACLRFLCFCTTRSRRDDPARGARYMRTGSQEQLLLSYIAAVAMVAEEGFMELEQFEELREAIKVCRTMCLETIGFSHDGCSAGCITVGALLPAPTRVWKPE